MVGLLIATLIGITVPARLRQQGRAEAANAVKPITAPSSFLLPKAFQDLPDR